jgi:hypothetical protein
MGDHVMINLNTFEKINHEELIQESMNLLIQMIKTDFLEAKKIDADTSISELGFTKATQHALYSENLINLHAILNNPNSLSLMDLTSLKILSCLKDVKLT